VLLIGAAPVAFAQPPVALNAAPAFAVVSGTKPEKGHVVLTRVVPIFEKVPFMLADNPKAPPRLVYLERDVMTEVEMYYDIGASRIITPDGKQLPIDEVWKRLHPGVIVVVSGDAKAPTPAFLQALRPTTLVIVPASPPRIEIKPSAKVLP
jgi:hypothetical protein